MNDIFYIILLQRSVLTILCYFKIGLHGKCKVKTSVIFFLDQREVVWSEATTIDAHFKKHS